MNITRQPLLVAFPTLLLLLAAMLVRKQGLSFPPESFVAVETLPEAWVTAFQLRFPRLAWGLWLLLHAAAALTLGRMGLRHSLYTGNTLLAIPLYGMVACGIFLDNHFLVGALSAFLLTRAMRNFCVSYRNGYAFSSLFRGALYLGMLPTLYAPALPLLLLLPLVTILFKRTLREWIVLLCGALFPMGSLCYLHWAITGQGGVPLQQMVACYTFPDHLRLFDGASPLLIAQLVVLLAATLCALFYYLSDIYAATSKARAILMLHAWMLLLALLSMWMPSATTNGFVLLAIPVAIFLPFLFVRLKRPLANGLYALLILLTLLRLFL